MLKLNTGCERCNLQPEDLVEKNIVGDERKLDLRQMFKQTTGYSKLVTSSPFLDILNISDKCFLITRNLN